MKISTIVLILCVIVGCNLIADPTVGDYPQMGLPPEGIDREIARVRSRVDPAPFVTALGAAFPSYAALMPLVALFFKRPRKHLIEAGKKLMPTDGTVDLIGAGRSVMKAVGLTHSKS